MPVSRQTSLRGWAAEDRVVVGHQLLAEVAYGSEISVSTEVIGFRRVWARRRSEFTPGGEARLVGLAITDWVLLNAQGRPVRPPHEIRDAFGPQVSEFTPLRLHEATPVAEATHDDFVVRRSELDPMGHVNNAAYLDYLDELYLTRAGHADVSHRDWLKCHPSEA